MTAPMKQNERANPEGLTPLDGDQRAGRSTVPASYRTPRAEATDTLERIRAAEGLDLCDCNNDPFGQGPCAECRAEFATRRAS